MPASWDALAVVEVDDGRRFPTGYIQDYREIARAVGALGRTDFAAEAMASGIVGSGDVSESVCLYRAEKAVTGGYLVHKQTIGDCVSHGYGGAIDTDVCLQVARGEAEWKGQTATEIVYAGSRVEIGGGRVRGDGSQGVWAARWVKEFGTLVRAVYGEWDLRTYSGQRARTLGAPGRGVPDELEPILRNFPVRMAVKLSRVEDAEDALANGYLVAYCGSQAFKMERDADGFLVPDPSRNWYHCMRWDTIVRGPRWGIGNRNSWGLTAHTGPVWEDYPKDGGIIPRDYADRMIKMGDTWAISGVMGLPRRPIPWDALAP